MKRILVCLIALFLIVGFYDLPSRVHGDYSGNMTINSDGSVTPSDAPITSSDNVTYVLFEDVNGSINVMKDNIIIEGAGYTLRGTGSIAEKGLDLSLRINVTIRNIQVREFYYGLYLSRSSNNAIIRNNMTNNVYGVSLIDSSTNNSIDENDFVNDGLRVISSYGNIVKDNLVNGKPLTYLEDMSNLTVNSNTGQVILVNCDRVTVENLSLAHTSCSVELVSTNNSKMANNRIADCQSGIGLWSSSNNYIYRNNITTNSIGGIGLGKSSINNTISENIIAKCPTGMEFVGSPDNTVSDNNITASIYTAIENLQSSNTMINKNNVGNSTFGIVFSGSSNNTLGENNILDNDNGVLLYNSSNNRIYHNNLLDNNQILTIQYSDPNFLDNGVEGNYWSNYNGTDNNQDGIGDTPYIIDENNTDHYPLMGTLYRFKVRHSYTNRIETVIIISNSTVENVGHYYVDNVSSPEGADWFLGLTGVVGKEGTVGFCRITFPNDMMNSSSYPVWLGAPEGTEIYGKIVESNGTYTTLYFTYDLPVSRSTIWILPEFPSYLILPLFFITTLLGIIVCRKRLTIC
jgi:parallel beta-helix repeat protein